MPACHAIVIDVPCGACTWASPACAHSDLWQGAAPPSGLQYSVHQINLAKGEQKEDWYCRINPNGRIPAIGESARRQQPLRDAQHDAPAAPRSTRTPTPAQALLWSAVRSAFPASCNVTDALNMAGPMAFLQAPTCQWLVGLQEASGPASDAARLYRTNSPGPFLSPPPPPLSLPRSRSGPCRRRPARV